MEFFSVYPQHMLEIYFPISHSYLDVWLFKSGFFMNTPGGHSYAYLYLNFTYRNRLITHFSLKDN